MKNIHIKKNTTYGVRNPICSLLILFTVLQAEIITFTCTLENRKQKFKNTKKYYIIPG